MRLRVLFPLSLRFRQYRVNSCKHSFPCKVILRFTLCCTCGTEAVKFAIYQRAANMTTVFHGEFRRAATAVFVAYSEPLILRSQGVEACRNINRVVRIRKRYDCRQFGLIKPEPLFHYPAMGKRFVQVPFEPCAVGACDHMKCLHRCGQVVIRFSPSGIFALTDLVTAFDRSHQVDVPAFRSRYSLIACFACSVTVEYRFSAIFSSAAASPSGMRIIRNGLYFGDGLPFDFAFAIGVPHVHFLAKGYQNNTGLQATVYYLKIIIVILLTSILLQLVFIP